MSVTYNRSVMANGITLVSENISHVCSVAAGLWVARGSRDEKPEENGLSHLIEHMSFKGTKSRAAKDIAMFLESIGGHLDAFTSKEETCFYARALGEHLSQTIEILSDIVVNPRYDQNDLERERKVILEEIKTVEDTPDELIHELFAEAVFDGHPLSYPILGSRLKCQGFKRSDLVSFRRNNYLPSHMVLAAVGQVNHHKLEALAERFLGSFEKAGSVEGIDSYVAPKSRMVARRKKTSQVHLCLGMRALGRSDSDRYALLVLNTIFGGGMSSRLFQKIREDEALAYSVYSFADFYRDTGLFGVYLGVAVEQAQKAAMTTLAEFHRLIAAPPTVQELDSAKAQLKGHLMLGLESTSDRMMRLAKMEISHEPYLDPGQTIKLIDGVSSEDLLRVAARIVKPEALACAVLGPVPVKILGLTGMRNILSGS